MTEAWQKERHHRTLTGRPWRRLREQIMNRDGWICQTCKRKGKITEATQCDHIIPVSKQGDNSAENLEAICDDCHEAKTQREAGNSGRVIAAIGVEGWPI